MQQIILKSDVDKSKIEALLLLLKAWGVEAEFKSSRPEVKNDKIAFSLSAGIWKDYDVDSGELRQKAWSRV